MLLWRDVKLATPATGGVRWVENSPVHSASAPVVSFLWNGAAEEALAHLDQLAGFMVSDPLLAQLHAQLHNGMAVVCSVTIGSRLRCALARRGDGAAGRHRAAGRRPGRTSDH